MPEEPINTLPKAREEIARLNTDLTAANELVDEINGKLAEVMARADQSDKDLKASQEESSALKQSLDQVSKERGELTQKNEEQAAKIAELEAKDMNASARAQEILANVGHPAVDIKPGDGDSAQSSLAEQYDKLEGAAKTEFFRKHKAALIAEKNKLKNQTRK